MRERGDSTRMETAPLGAAPTDVPPAPSSIPPRDVDGPDRPGGPDQRGMAGEVTRRVEGRPDVYLGVSAGPNGVPTAAIAAGAHDAGPAPLAALPPESDELRRCRLTVEDPAALRTRAEAVLDGLGLGYADAGSCTLGVLVGEPTPDQLEPIRAELGPDASVVPAGEMLLFRAAR